MDHYTPHERLADLARQWRVAIDDTRETPGSLIAYGLFGETAVVLDDISVNGIGKAEMRGTPWNTRNVSGRPLARGERCKVERVEGLTIFVRAETT